MLNLYTISLLVLNNLNFVTHKPAADFKKYIQKIFCFAFLKSDGGCFYSGQTSQISKNRVNSAQNSRPRPRMEPILQNGGMGVALSAPTK